MTKTMTKERSVILYPHEVRAILDERQVQFRRVIKPPAEVRSDFILETLDNGDVFWKCPDYNVGVSQACPYGKAGDRLWCRESFWLEMDSEFSEFHGQMFYHSVLPSESDWCSVYYPATDPDPNTVEDLNFSGTRWLKKPSIHMPRFHSRITLEVTNVRVELLQDITEEEAIAEGCYSEYAKDLDLLVWKTEKRQKDYQDKFGEGVGIAFASARGAFADLWDSINISRGYSWESNPHVWVVRFKRI